MSDKNRVTAETHSSSVSLNDVSPAVSDLDQEKAKIDLEKSRLELRRLRHPIRTSLLEFGWKEIAAIVVATGGILLGWLTGWFNVRQERIAVDTARLQIERDKLEKTNSELENTRSGLKAENHRLEAQLEKVHRTVSNYDMEREQIRYLSSMNRPLGRDSTTPTIRAEVALTEDADHFKITLERIMVGEQYTDDAGPIVTEPRMTEIIDRMVKIPRLRSLIIRNVTLTRQETERIAKLGILHELQLHRNGLTDDALEPIGALKAVKILGVTCNAIREMRAIASLPELRVLYLHKTEVGDMGLAQLAPLSGCLQKAWLDDTKVSDKGIQDLNKIHGLVLVSLGGTKVTGEGLKRLDSQIRALLADKNQLTKDVQEHLRKRADGPLIITYPDGTVPPL